MSQSTLKKKIGLCVMIASLLGAYACDDDEKTETKDPCAKCTADQTCVDNKCVDKEEPEPENKCGDEVCTGEQTCEDGKCVDKIEEPDPDLCGDAKCTEKQKCVESVCRDLCGSDVCKDGEKCVDSECKPLCGTEVCTEDEVCKDGICKATCGGEICTDAQECDASIDKCVPLGCSGITCGENETCNAGECFCGDDKCEENETCSAEQVCESTESKCESVTCDVPNETCNEATGACDCGGATCNEGEYCNDEGKCIEGDPCEGIECEDGETCFYGQCICKGAGAKCEEGKTCEYDVCVDTECVGKTCEEGLVCAKGECIDPACVGVTCDDPGLSCSGGNCVDAACLGIECPADRQCKEGHCRLDSTPKLKVINATGDLTSEDGTETVRLAVFLDTKPIHDVTVTAMIDDVSEAEVSGAESLTFTADDYEDPQYFNIVGLRDYIIDGEQPYKVQLSSESEDLDFNGLTKDVELKNRDDDKASIVLKLPDSLMTSEAGEAVKITAQLSVEPTEDVVLKLTSTNTKEGKVSPASIKFDAANWNEAHTITVTGVDDLVEDGNIAYQLTFAVETNDPNFKDLKVEPIDLINADNDQAGLAVSATSLTINEGANGVVKVNLNTKPSANVIVSAVSSNAKGATVSPATLTFTAKNYNKAQNFTISGVHDQMIAGDKMAEITLKTDDTAPEYKGMTHKITTLVKEIDKASILLEGCPASIKEGATGKCEARLSAIPTANVTVAAASNAKTEMTVSPASLTFTKDNWGTAQTLTLTGVKDQVIDGPKNAKLTLTATSKDTNFSGKTASQTVEIADINTAAITAKCTSQALSETDVTTTYNCKVRLNAKPTKNVVLKFKSTDKTELKLTSLKASAADLITGTFADGQVTIQAAKWKTVDDSYIQFNYVAVDDSQADGTQTAYLQFNTTSDDANFNSKSLKVKVTVTDNEKPDLVLTSPGALTCGANATGSVKLAAQPTGDVTVSLAIDNKDGLTLSPAAMTFTKDNYNTAQTFTITTRKDGTEPPEKAYYAAVNISAAVSNTIGAYTPDIKQAVAVAYTAFCPVNITKAGATGSVKLPKGTFTIKARGGKGGGVNANLTLPHGGMPAEMSARLTLKAPQTVTYAVGGQGVSCYNTKACGGKNGGGNGSYSTNSANAGYGGGGATELVAGAKYDYTKRILIAAGGGGSSNTSGNANGGQAGPLLPASNGAFDNTHNEMFAKAAGATNKTKYLNGDSVSATDNGAGGGGAGWNGGQAGQMKFYSGAAGESFFFTGVTKDYTAKGGKLEDATFALTKTSLATSGATGKTVNGYIKITAVASEPK